jgi:hypothetical protein
VEELMSIYAQVQTGSVINTVIANSTDMFNPSYIWVDVTSYNPIPSIGWTTIDNVNFVTNIPALNLSQAINANIQGFQNALMNFIDTSYSVDARLNFNAIYTLAIANSLPNRAAYIFQLFSWAEAVVTYASTYIASIMAMTDLGTVNSTTWNFASISVSNPTVTITGALEISS